MCMYIHTYIHTYIHAYTHTYIHTDCPPVALYTHVFRFEVYFESRCGLVGKARVERNVYIVRRATDEYVCMYINTIYSVSVLIKTIFAKNGKVGRGALSPLGFF